MNNKEYLNEEKYQQNNKKLKKAGLIVMSIGIVLIIINIVLIIVNQKPFSGILFSLGFMLTLIGAVLKFYLGNARQISAYMVQQQMPVAKEGIEKIAPSAGVAAKEIAKGVKEGLKDDEDK